jgi:hypothetical protein
MQAVHATLDNARGTHYQTSSSSIKTKLHVLHYGESHVLMRADSIKIKNNDKSAYSFRPLAGRGPLSQVTKALPKA